MKVNKAGLIQTNITEPSIDEVDIDAVSEYMNPCDSEWVVAPGLEISSKRGLLKSGELVKSVYFKHGQSVLDEMIKNGSVVKK
jgi:hypothetical protein